MAAKIVSSKKSGLLLCLAAAVLWSSCAAGGQAGTGQGSSLGNIFESKQTRYRRELREADEQRKKEEELRWQQEQMEKNKAEIERLRSRKAPSTPYYNRLPKNEKGRANNVAVDLFVASDCSDCERMEQYLKEMGVPYEKKWLAENSPAEQDYMTNIGRGALPVTRINGKVVRGYEPERVRKIILDEKQRY